MSSQLAKHFLKKICIYAGEKRWHENQLARRGEEKKLQKKTWLFYKQETVKTISIISEMDVARG